MPTLGNTCPTPAAPSPAFRRLPLPSFREQVYRAICKQYQEEVAVKLLDLENMNCSLDEIVREAQVCGCCPPALALLCYAGGGMDGCWCWQWCYCGLRVRCRCWAIGGRAKAALQPGDGKLMALAACMSCGFLAPSRQALA